MVRESYADRLIVPGNTKLFLGTIRKKVKVTQVSIRIWREGNTRKRGSPPTKKKRKRKKCYIRFGATFCDRNETYPGMHEKWHTKTY